MAFDDDDYDDVFDDVPIPQSIPAKYEDIGHEDIGHDEKDEPIPWFFIDGELVFGANTHMDILKPIVKNKGKEYAFDVLMNSWRGRYDPVHHEMSMTIEKAHRTGQEVQPPPALLTLLQIRFPDVERIWSFPGSRPVLGYFNDNALNRVYKFAWKRDFSNHVKIAQYNPQQVPEFLAEEFEVTISDVDRYTADKYSITVQLLESLDKYSIGLNIINSHVGICGHGQYWHFEKNELSKARKTFAKIKKIAQKLHDEIEYIRPPMAIIAPMFRSSMHYVDYPHRERSGVYHYNWFEELPKVADWRCSLYGKRYPYPPTSTQQMADFFINTDEQSKNIVFEGSSRQRQAHYKHANGDDLWLATFIGKHWRWTIPTATAFLWWFSHMGGNSNQLIQDVQHGATPTEILRQVQPENMDDQVSQNEEFASETPGIPPEISQNSRNSLDESHKIDTMSVPAGIRNNNPGNIRRTDDPWEGLSENQDDERFFTFDSPEYGVRAMARLLRNYQRNYNLKTVEEIINKWAPANENDTESYIEHVLQQLGIPPHSGVNLEDDGLLTRLIKVMIRHENGGDFIDDNTIQNGISLEKSGSNHTYHYAYQITDKFEAKARMFAIMRELQTTDWNAIVQSLIVQGVDRRLFSWLNEKFIISLAKSRWSRKYAVLR